MKMVNLGNITRDASIEIAMAILKETLFVNKAHDLRNTAAGPLLQSYGLDPSDVYCSISPSIHLRFLDKETPSGQSVLRLDIKDLLSGGDPNCEHEGISLYWEVGGGGMDSGTPHTYVMCRKCGYSEKKVLFNFRKFWTGSEKGCWLFHDWDDPYGATRTCKKCGKIEVMSHL